MGFLEKLVEKQIINRYQLNDILEKTKEMSGDIDRVLELYKVPADAVRAAKSVFFGVPEIIVPDVTQSELLSIKDLENKVLKLTDKLIPLSTSYTQSGKAGGQTKQDN